MDISRSFPTTGPVLLDVKNASGDVTVTARDTDHAEVRVTSKSRDVPATVELDGNRLIVHIPDRFFIGIRLHGVHIDVVVPTGSSVRSRTASSGLKITGRIATLEAQSSSGDIRADDVAEHASFTTASGRVRLGTVTGAVEGTTASGDVTVECAESVTLRAASGDVTVSELGDSAAVKAVSGDVTIRRAGQGTVEVQAVSGRLHLGVANGTAARLELNTVSGRLNSELPLDDSVPGDGTTLEIIARTISGDITVARA